MSRGATLLALALLVGGCGGGSGDGGGGPQPDTAERDQDARRNGSAEACAQARRTIGDLPKPKDNEGDADYADQAADALEKVDSPAVKPLRDAELAIIELRMRAFNRAASRLQRIRGECGEREAARVLVLGAYAYEIDDAIRDHNRKSRTAPTGLVPSLQFDARRFARLTRRMKAVAVPEALRVEHRRFLGFLERSTRFYRSAAADPGSFDPAADDRLDARRDRATKQLRRKLNRMV